MSEISTITLMLAEVMSRKELIDTLRKSILEYDISPIDDNWESISINCLLIVTKRACEHTEGGSSSIIESLKKQQKVSDIINHSPQ